MAATEAARQALEAHTATGIENAEPIALITEAHKTFGNSAASTVGQLTATTRVVGVANKVEPEESLLPDPDCID